MKERYRTILTGLYAALIVALTLAPVPITSAAVAGYDKAAHALMFAGLSFLIYWSFLNRRPWLLAIACGVVGAGLIELLQMPLPYRSGDPLDFGAGVVGAMVGTGFGLLILD